MVQFLEEIILNRLAAASTDLETAIQNASANQNWSYDQRFQKPATVSRSASATTNR
jgi:hypothetical protein